MIGALNNFIGQIAEDLGAKKLNTGYQTLSFRLCVGRVKEGGTNTHKHPYIPLQQCSTQLEFNPEDMHNS